MLAGTDYHGRTIARLHASTQRILSQAIKSGGSSIRDFRAPDGTRGHYQESHLIYQKTGIPCPRGCQTSIRRLATARSSFYCQRCPEAILTRDSVSMHNSVSENLVSSETLC